MLGTKRNIYPSVSATDAVLRAIDAGCILLALRVAIHPAFAGHRESYWLVGAVGIASFTLIGAFCGMYRNWRGAWVEREITCGLITWCVTLVILLASGFLTGRLVDFSTVTVIVWFFATGLLIAGNRVAIRTVQRTLRARGMNTRRYAIVGVNELAFQLAENVENSPELGLQLVGFFDDRPESRTPHVPDAIGRRVGDLDELVRAARDRTIDMIYITFPMRAEDRIRKVLARLADSTASVYIVPDFFVFELLHSRWTNIGGLPAVSIFEHPFYGVDGIVKRCADLLLAGCALLLAALPLAAIALVIKATSPGPVFFRQRRYGLDGTEIFVWKFRSMRVCEDGDRVVQATRHDARITAVGRVLRKTSLDELPQLFNVLDGSMSLVGPRPHATAHNEHYRTMIQGYMLRHKVKPGITGLAQVNGCRGETDTVEKMRQRVEFDHRYIREWSLWLDLKILFQTVLVVLSGRDAY